MPQQLAGCLVWREAGRHPACTRRRRPPPSGGARACTGALFTSFWSKTCKH